MKRLFIWAAAAIGGTVLAASAGAQNVQPDLVSGKVKSASASELVITTQGLSKTYALTPKTTIMTSHAGTLKDIKAGSFLGATNTPTGATEVHIFPPGVQMGEGDRPMGPAGGAQRMTNGTVSSTAPAAADSGGTRMTNGSVGTVAKSGAGITMDVAYAGGHRSIVVTSATPIVVLTTLKATALKPGANVLVGSVPGANGQPTAQFVNVQP